MPIFWFILKSYTEYLSNRFILYVKLLFNILNVSIIGIVLIVFITILHVNDNPSYVPYGRLFKYFVNEFNSIFLTLFVPILLYSYVFIGISLIIVLGPSISV